MKSINYKCHKNFYNFGEASRPFVGASATTYKGSFTRARKHAMTPLKRQETGGYSLCYRSSGRGPDIFNILLAQI